MESYTARDLRTIHDFLGRGNHLLEQSARELRGSAVGEMSGSG